MPPRHLPWYIRALACLLLAGQAMAEELPPLRFAVSDGWTMPLINILDGQASGGILYDLQLRLAEKVGRRAELLVRPRLRMQQMLVSGEIDVRCYVNPAWLQESHHQYIWSVPFMVQHDLLVGRDARPVALSELNGESIGTVLGFVYPTLEPQFASGQLRRDDARSQELVLEKLHAGRQRYGVSNSLSLAWYNREHAGAQQLYPVKELAADLVACIVRDEPDIPTMRLLRALVQMSQDGEFEAILARYR